MTDIGRTGSVRHIIFDLDSTLTDSLRGIAVTRSLLLEQLLEVVPVSHQRKMMSVFRSVLIDDIHDTEIIPKICRSLQLDPETHGTLDLIHRQFLDSLSNNTTLLDGGQELLEELARRRISMVIWTNKRLPFVIRQLSALNIGRYFKKVYCKPKNTDNNCPVLSEIELPIFEVPLSHKKPSPEFLRVILSENNFDDAHTLFVGNNVKKDGGSTVGTAVHFVHAKFGIPTTETQQLLFSMTGLDIYRSSTETGDIDRSSAHHISPVATIESSLLELLALLD
jgi:phosphoglycolate phosphatase-like HAD superfamily hydrolase